MLRRKQKIKKIDTPLYRFWQALFLCFYSSKLYVDVVKRWPGFGIRYLLFYLLIACIPYSIKSIILMNESIQSQIVEPLNLIPEFTIENGKVYFDKMVPYFVKNSKGEVVVIVDNSDKITKIGKDNPNLVFLINSNKIYFKTPNLRFLKGVKNSKDFFQDKEFNVYNLTSDYDGDFDGQEFLKESGIMGLKIFFLCSVYPVLVAIIFGMLVTLMLAIAIMGQVVAYAIFKFKITYKQACRVSAIAGTIGFWALMFFKTTDMETYSNNLICMAIVFIYFSYGILAAKRESKKMVLY